jgi:hypothetical protein
MLKLYVNHGRKSLAQIETCKVGGECRVNRMEPGLDYDMYKDDSYDIVFIFENMSPDLQTVSTVYINIPVDSADKLSTLTDANGAMTLGASLVAASALAFLF